MTCRRLVGIDLGIASAHTVRVLDEHEDVGLRRRARRVQVDLAGPLGTARETIARGVGHNIIGGDVQSLVGHRRLPGSTGHLRRRGGHGCIVPVYCHFVIP